MKKVLLLKFGELFLKGKNKKEFEKQLIGNIKIKLIEYDFDLTVTPGRILISGYRELLEENIISDLTNVFGLISVSKAVELDTSVENIENYIAKIDIVGTFRVNVKRADKTFPIHSTDFEAKLGGIVLDNCPESSVDLHNPKTHIYIDIRLNKKTYIYYESVKCRGGLPLGTAGSALLMLSGGIDSPVAGYMMAKRGVIVDAVHFEAPPYTSDRARLKVEELAKIMSEYTGAVNFHCVPFTRIQEMIKEHCPEELFTIVMRRIMMEISQRIALSVGASCLVTGESIGQVASQTMLAMVCTDAVCKIPVFRPLIGMDKTEIVEVSRKIGTYDTSIEPYEDCCTVFTPRHPKTKPRLEEVEKAQAAFDFEPLINQAINDTKAYIISAN